MKGCPLNCWWCHNPESRSAEIACYTKKEKINGMLLERLETVGKSYSVSEVMNEVEKDVVLYEEAGGGMTLSGGEPFYQFDFMLHLLKSAKKKDIHTCVDTTGLIKKELLLEAAEYTDLFLYDLKFINEEKHTKHTGVSNKVILDNLITLDKLQQNIEIRYPLIPGINDDESDLLLMLAFLKKLKRAYPVSILPYHKIGNQKYERFGIEDKMNNIEEPTKERVEEIENLIGNAGFKTSIGG